MIQLGLGAALIKPPEWIDDKRMVKTTQLDAWARWVREAPELVLDYEASGLDTKRGAAAFMVGAFSPDKGAKVLDLRLTGEAGHRAAVDALRARTGITIVHNAKAELSFSRQLGFELQGKLWDNLCAGFAYDERLESHSQKYLVKKLLGQTTPYADAVHSWMTSNLGTTDAGHEQNPNMLEVPYNCEDVTGAWDLYQFFRKGFESQGRVQLVWDDSQMMRAVEEMENTGLDLDMNKLGELSKVWAAKRAEIYKAVTGALGRHIDLASHKALFGLLYGQYGLPMHKDLEKEGKLDEDVLLWMLALPEVIDKPAMTTILQGIMDYRELDKLLGTYVLPWMHEHQINGVLYPNINVDVARTRRFSGERPNLQNIPARSKLGKELRRALIARMGWTVYELDFSQIEYRAFVNACGEAALVNGYRSKRDFDIHALVAAMCEVSRDDGKHLNFGMLFGMGVEKLARKLRCSMAKAREILDRYHARVPSVKRLKKELEREIMAKGYVQSSFGGRRHLVPSDAFKALNTRCQMDGADLNRRALACMWSPVKKHGGHFQVTIHDSNKFRLPGPPEEHHEAIEEIGAAMESAGKGWRVPVYISRDYYTTNWSEAEEYAAA